MIVLAVIFQWAITLVSFGIAWSYMNAESPDSVVLAIVWASFGITATCAANSTLKAILQ